MSKPKLFLSIILFVFPIYSFAMAKKNSNSFTTNSVNQCRTKTGDFGSLEILPNEFKLSILELLGLEDLVNISKSNKAICFFIQDNPHLYFSDLIAIHSITKKITHTIDITELYRRVSKYSLISNRLLKKVVHSKDSYERIKRILTANSSKLAIHILTSVGTNSSSKDIEIKSALLYRTKDLPGMSYEDGITLHKRVALIKQHYTTEQYEFKEFNSGNHLTRFSDLYGY